MSAHVTGLALRLKRELFGSTQVLTMKKSSKKKSSKKKSLRKIAVKSAKRKPASTLTSKARSKRGPLNKQPQVKQQAAVAHGMFLYADDAWSLRYFDENDLHFKEREVFG
jgi:hypothetical protein